MRRKSRKVIKQAFDMKIGYPVPDNENEETAESIFKMSVMEKRLDEMMGALTDEEQKATALCIEHLLPIPGIKRISIEQKFDRKGEVAEFKVIAVIREKDKQ